MMSHVLVSEKCFKVCKMLLQQSLNLVFNYLSSFKIQQMVCRNWSTSNKYSLIRSPFSKCIQKKKNPHSTCRTIKSVAGCPHCHSFLHILQLLVQRRCQEQSQKLSLIQWCRLDKAWRHSPFIFSRISLKDIFRFRGRDVSTTKRCSNFILVTSVNSQGFLQGNQLQNNINTSVKKVSKCWIDWSRTQPLWDLLPNPLCVHFAAVFF